MLSVVLPDSAEVGLIRNEALLLVRKNHIFLRDEFRDELTSCLPFFLELLTTLWGSGINTEDKLVILISVGEGIKVLVGIIEMATISEPGGLGDLVVEEA